MHKRSFFWCIAAFSLLSNIAIGADKQAIEGSKGGEAEKKPTPKYNCPKAEYPWLANKHNKQGISFLEMTVTETGNVTDVVVVQSSGDQYLDEAAVEIVSKCKFKPNIVDGAPKAVPSHPFEIIWRLVDGPPFFPRYPLHWLEAKQLALPQQETSKFYTVSPVPPQVPYEELTAENKLYLKAGYDRLPDTVEPPYPVGGMNALLDPLKQAFATIFKVGIVRMEVDVDEHGKAKSVEIFESPNPALANFASRIAMMTDFKPATCSGKPCAMKFPVRALVKRRHYQDAVHLQIGGSQDQK